MGDVCTLSPTDDVEDLEEEVDALIGVQEQNQERPTST